MKLKQQVCKKTINKKNCYKGHYYQSFTKVQHRKLCLKQFYSNETYGLTKAKFFSYYPPAGALPR